MWNMFQIVCKKSVTPDFALTLYLQLYNCKYAATIITVMGATVTASTVKKCP